MMAHKKAYNRVVYSVFFLTKECLFLGAECFFLRIQEFFVLFHSEITQKYASTKHN